MFCPEKKGCFSSVMDSSIHFQYAKRKGRGCCTNKYKVVAYQDVLQLTPVCIVSTRYCTVGRTPLSAQTTPSKPQI